MRCEEANPLGEPIILVKPEVRNGIIGRLLGFHPLDADKCKIVWTAVPFNSEPKHSDEIFLREENRQGVLRIRKKLGQDELSCSPDETICYLTQEGETDAAPLLMSNIIRDVISEAVDKTEQMFWQDIQLGDHLIRARGVILSVGLDGFQNRVINSHFFLVLPDDLPKYFRSIIDFRDDAITKRLNGLLGRTKSRLEKDMRLFLG